MITNATNRRNSKFLLLFGVFCFCGFESYADPVFSVYKKIHNSANVRNIREAKNGIYVNKFKKLRAQDHRNNLFNHINGVLLSNYPYYPNSFLRYVGPEVFYNVGFYKNGINRNWNLKSIEDSVEDQNVYINDYRSRLFKNKGHVFYDHYLSQMQTAKKNHHSFRKFLHNFRVNISTGFSGMYDLTKVDGFFFNENGKYFLSPTFQGRYINYAYQIGWFGESYKKVPMTISSSRYANFDTNSKLYTGLIGSITFINLGLSYDFQKRWRFELDFNFKGSRIEKLKRHYQTEKTKSSIHAKASTDNIDEVLMPNPNFFGSDVRFLVGTKVFNTTFWSVLVNFQLFFNMIYDKKGRIVDGSSLGGLTMSYPGLGAGMTVERHLSDYVSLFARGMFGVTKLIWKNEWVDNAKCFVEHQVSNLSFDFGINFTSSYIDKCEHERGCKIKEVHIHNSTEYRGLNKWRYRSNYGKVIHSVK